MPFAAKFALILARSYPAPVVLLARPTVLPAPLLPTRELVSVAADEGAFKLRELTLAVPLRFLKIEVLFFLAPLLTPWLGILPLLDAGWSSLLTVISLPPVLSSYGLDTFDSWSLLICLGLRY